MFNNVQEGANMANTVQQAAPLPPEGYVRLHQVLAVIPISRSSWFAGIKSGKYPRGIRLGERTTVYRVDDIRALIESV